MGRFEWAIDFWALHVQVEPVDAVLGPPAVSWYSHRPRHESDHVAETPAKGEVHIRGYVV
jgi:hypothetical protein